MELGRVDLWRDEVPRTGPENMAVDEWLLATVTTPVLRFYRWKGAWVSLGYFDPLAAARGMFAAEEVSFVRRATGGGIVDHRVDQTYTLVVPKGERLAGLRGAGSYGVIHAALAAALGAAGIEAVLTREDAAVDSAACFEKPVAWDLTDGRGRKIAGAGQRRTKHGLLHQGSVQGAGEGVIHPFAGRLAGEVVEARIEPDEAAIAGLVSRKFGAHGWLERR
ncbi:MAG: lipoate--protein ligase family protein [Akkermansiaceae bacterium]|nr:lipoate--protein ligase family protein [Akkermansiaceae bacterium]